MDKKYTFSTNGFLAYYLTNATTISTQEDGYLPIVSRPIGINNQSNIVIEGTFITNYATYGALEDGIAYITVRRPLVGIQKVHDGYGIAFRTSNPLDSGKNNLFIVDNGDLITEGVSNEYRNYIVAAAWEILINQVYYYRVVVTQTNAMMVWITTNIEELGDPDYVAISTGARVNVRKKNPSNEICFGFAVKNTGIQIYGTGSYTWKFDDLVIKSYADRHPAVYFEMDTSLLPNSFCAHYNAIGYGYDDDILTYGVQLWVFNVPLNAWELLGENSSEAICPTGYTETKLLTRNRYVIDDRAHLMLSTTYPSSANNLGDAGVQVDLFELRSPVANRVGLGGMVDIYINDENLIEKDLEVSPTTNVYVLDVSPDVPVWIKAIYNSEDTEMEYYTEYMWGFVDNKLMSSSRGKIFISSNTGWGAGITIVYYHSPALKALSNVNNDVNFGFKGNDLLPRHMKLYWIEPTVPDDDADILEAIADYVEEVNTDEDKTISYAALVTAIMVAGLSATGVSLEIHYYDEGMVRAEEITAVGDTLTIDRISIYRIFD